MDVSTLTASNIIFKQVNGEVIPTTLEYNSVTMTVKLTPNFSSQLGMAEQALTPGTQYQVTVVGSPTGVKSVTGDYMMASRTYEFTTSFQTYLSSPTALNVVVDSGFATVTYLQPLEYDVALPLTYEVMISASNDPLIAPVWPSTGDINQLASTTLNVPKKLPEGGYYAYVRAHNGSGVSEWTSMQFSVSAPVIAPTPGTTPTPGMDVFSLDVVETYPRRDDVDVTPEKIMVIFSSDLDVSTVNEDNIYIIKKEDKDNLSILDLMTDYAPAKKVAAVIEPSVLPNMVTLTATLEDDAEYTVIIRGTVKGVGGEGLGVAYHWSFMTKFTQLYGDAEMIRADLGPMGSRVSNKVLYKTMRDSSIHAYNIVSQTLNFVAAGYVDGKAPYYMHQYVRHRTAYDLILNGQIQQSSGAGSSISLGDLSVDKKSSGSQGQSLSLKDFKDRIKPWEDAIHGHNNRGYAKPVAVVKGENGAAYPAFFSRTEFADLGQ